ANLLKEMLAPHDGGGPGWVDMAVGFDDLLAGFGLYAGGRPVRLRLAPQPPRGWGEPPPTPGGVAYFVGQSLRCLDKEGGQNEISVRPGGDDYVFWVADNGPGIPAEYRERIFEPFVRGPAAQGQAESTGLGLYFVRSVIEQSGGRVWVESTPGEGSRFY